MKTVEKHISTKSKLALNTIFTMLILFGFLSCSKEEDGEDLVTEVPKVEEEVKSIFGRWEVLSGTLVYGDNKFIYINKENTIDILDEDNLGFRNEFSTNITVTENQFTMSSGEGGSSIYNYSFESDGSLNILSPDGDPVKLKKTVAGPIAEEWIKDISILSEGNSLWERKIDIAFDGNYLLGYHDYKIHRVDPNDLSIVDSFTTAYSCVAVELEKSDSSFRQLFQVQSSSDSFHSFIYSSNEKYYTSIEIGGAIKGIASVTPGYLWVSSHNEKSLYYYKSNGALSPGEILETVALNFQPNGLDYQNGFLYVTDYDKVFKCQTTPVFKAVETYELPRHDIGGIAFDGNSFWLSAESYAGDVNKLLKVDIPF